MSSLIEALLGQPTEAQGLMSILPMLQGMQGGSSVQSGAPTSQTTSPMDAGHWQDVAHRMAMQRGYTDTGWNDLNNIIMRESHWNPNAVNPNGGAYGIPQILPASHPDAQLQNDPRGQLKWLFQYINGRYGSPEAAWQFKQNNGWY
jgi:hypothetical protein